MSMPPSAPARPGDVLHGGARRLPLRWANLAAGAAPPQVISRYQIAPGDSCTLHIHTGKAEIWVILAGRGVARLDGQSYQVEEGDILVTPPQVAHALDNTGGEPLVFLNLVHPTGDAPITTREIGAGQ